MLSWIFLLVGKGVKLTNIFKDSQTLHFVIIHDQGKYLINEESSTSFDSIPKLIEEFHAKKMPLSKLSAATLKRPVSNFKKSSPKKPLRVPSIKNGIALGMARNKRTFIISINYTSCSYVRLNYKIVPIIRQN